MTSDYKAYFKHVHRKAFTKLCDQLGDNDLQYEVTIHYAGTHLFGDLTIEAYSNNEESFKKALELFVSENL